MSWPEPARSEESAEDRALRDELRLMLGVSAPITAQGPTAESRALADDLVREARRRSHTPVLLPFRRRPSWSLMAAALPVALLIGGLGVWGARQHRKAEALAAEVAAKEAELKRREQHIEDALRREREILVPAATQVAQDASRPRRAPKEVVLPSNRAETPGPVDVQRVKNPR